MVEKKKIWEFSCKCISIEGELYVLRKNSFQEIIMSEDNQNKLFLYQQSKLLKSCNNELYTNTKE